MEKYPDSPPPAYPEAQPPLPQGQYGSPAPPPPGPVVVTQTHVHAGAPLNFSETPMIIQCQFCQATVTTATDRITGLMTWLAVGGVCLFGGWLGCCLIPFCIDPLKDVEHRCPNCNNIVGYYRMIR